MQRHIGVLVLAGLWLVVSGCQSRLLNKEKGLRGFFDTDSYTAPAGTFSIDLREFADPATIRDTVEDEGASLRLRFSDVQGAEYTILVTYTLSVAPVDFIDQLVEKRRAVDKNVIKTKTPARIDCLLSNGFHRYKKSDRVCGEINLVFYQERAVFNLLISSPPFLRAQEAATTAEAALNVLWKRTRFRGRLDQLQPISSQQDPRVPIVVGTALRTASQLKYAVDVQRTNKPIVRMTPSGETKDIILSIGVNRQGKRLHTTEAVSCPAPEKKIGRHKLEVFYNLFQQELKKEKLYVHRELTYDAELLLAPR